MALTLVSGRMFNGSVTRNEKLDGGAIGTSNMSKIQLNSLRLLIGQYRQIILDYM